MTERFPFGPSTRPAPPLFPREQRVSPDRPAAVQGAKRRSEPLTARTDLESGEARGKGDFLPTRVAPTFVLKYNIRTRSLVDPGVIEDILAVENDVVSFDRADVLEQGCVDAFLGDSPRAQSPHDLLGLPIFPTIS